MNRNQKSNKQLSTTVRCAIYTRKSTEEGLEQEFNTLDAQRESGEAYIASQKNEGWECLPDRYDDGGFSGGNLERPALKRLLADVEAGKVNCIVVYKVDRLSRSLLDFARIMEVFDQRKVAFVSVTQQFNTSTPMGRLVLNVLLSFAQFEREIIGERIRDKIAAQRRKGKWAGGFPILGYDVDRSGGSPKLVVSRDLSRDQVGVDYILVRLQFMGDGNKRGKSLTIRISPRSCSLKTEDDEELHAVGDRCLRRWGVDDPKLDRHLEQILNGDGLPALTPGDSSGNSPASSASSPAL